MRHTKGKWYLQKFTDHYTNIIRCDNGKGQETLWIASTPQNSGSEARENAKLISKAPEMYEALKDVLIILNAMLKIISWKSVRKKILNRVKKIESLLKEIEDETTN